MKLFRWVFLLAFALPVHAQDCDNVVVDQASALKPGQSQQIADAAQGLISQGADVRVRTVGATTNLDTNEKQFVATCPSWEAPNGSIKSTLVVLMVSPASRKMGIYYGHAFDAALNDHWNRIKQEYMAPHFRTADWAGGFIAAEQQLAARIKASQDEALHPAVSTTVNQATDLSGLWSVLKWLVLIGALALAVFFWVSWQMRRRKAYQQRREARANAINAKARAANLLSSTAKDQPGMDAALEEFSRLDSTLNADPYDEKLEVSDYNAIAASYLRVCDMVTQKTAEPSSPDQTPAQQPPKRGRKGHRHPVRYGDSGTVYHDTTTVVPVPIPISEPTWEPEPSHSSSHSDDSDSGGGSSSWGDSGSSDSGGGGSSDFGGGGGDFGGGGGDSGGGGSSGF
jgi:uncharacterized membrane protein YgcG